MNISSVIVKVNGATCVDSNSLVQHLNLRNQKIIFVNQDKITAQVQKDYLCVKSISLIKKLPNTLEIDLSPRQAVAVLDSVEFSGVNKLDLLPPGQLEATPSSQSAFVLADEEQAIRDATDSGKFLIDATGLIFDRFGSNVGAPTLIYAGEALKLGDRVDKELVINSNELLDGVRNLSINFTQTPIIFENSLFLSTDRIKRLRFNLKGEISRELASLQLILEAGTINQTSSSEGGKHAQGFESIDLRFDKPVVVYSK